MDKHLLLAAMSAAVLGLASCADEQENNIAMDGNDNISFTATAAEATDGLTKTAIVSGTPVFSGSESLIVYGGNGSSALLTNNATAQSATATFTGTLDNAAYTEFSNANVYYGILPSSATTGIVEDAVSDESATIKMNLTPNPKAVANGIDGNAHLLVGTTTGTEFNFKSVCAYLKLNLQLACTKIEVSTATEGAQLAGDFNLKLSADGTFSVSRGNWGQVSTTITLQGDMAADNYYYIPVLPGTYALDITMTYSDDKTYTMNLTTRTTESNHVYSVKLMKGVELPQEVLHEYVPTSATSISLLYTLPAGEYTEITKESASGTYDIPTGLRIYQKKDATEYVITSDKGYYTLAPVDCSYMFAGCYKKDGIYDDIDRYPNLTSLTFENFNTKNVTDMSYMFRNLPIESIDLSTFNTAKVTNMTSLFHSCTKLTSIDISSFNTENVTDMSYMFGDCEALANLDLSNISTANVEDMECMFEVCAFETIDLSKFNTAKVKNMNGMFASCMKLTVLDLSSFNTENVTEMGFMFTDCIALEKIYASSSFSTEKVLDEELEDADGGTDMFSNCISLRATDGDYEFAYGDKHTDATYARICKAADRSVSDTEEDTQGYFTDMKYKPSSK